MEGMRQYNELLHYVLQVQQNIMFRETMLPFFEHAGDGPCPRQPQLHGKSVSEIKILYGDEGVHKICTGCVLQCAQKVARSKGENGNLVRVLVPRRTYPLEAIQNYVGFLSAQELCIDNSIIEAEHTLLAAMPPEMVTAELSRMLDRLLDQQDLTPNQRLAAPLLQLLVVRDSLRLSVS
jgi:hypothetical protein